MSIDKLSGDFYLPSRKEIVDQHQRNYKFRLPTARVGEGTMELMRGSAIADTILPLYSNSLALANDVDLDNKTREGLIEELARAGAEPPFEAVGGSGYVTIEASAGGGKLFEGDTLSDPETSFLYEVAETRKYFNGDSVPIRGLSTGSSTNLPAGTILRWTSQRPGIKSKVVVNATPRGTGLEYGRGAETDSEIRARIRAAKANPAAAGNDADIQQKVFATPGVAVQQAFTYTMSPALTNFTFTQAPATIGSSRAPTAVSLAAARARLIGAFPKGDGYRELLILEQQIDLMVRVKWARGTKNWVDAVPWPPYTGGGILTQTVSAVTDSMTFQVASNVVPQVGQTFAFFDRVNRTFKRKRVLSASSPGPGFVDIVCDPTNSASDVDYYPTVGDIPCPYSESLDTLIEPTLEAFEGLGPGEMVASFFDEGFRQRRSPDPNDAWPSELSSKSFRGYDDLDSATSVIIAYPTIPYATPVGVPNVSVNLLVLGRLSAFPT